MKPASLSARITTLLVVTSLLVLGGGAKLMDWRVDHELESRFQQNLLTQASALSTMLQLEQDEAPGDQRPHLQAGLLGGDSPTFYEVRCDGMPALHSTPPPPASPPDWARQTDSQPRFADLHHADQQLGSVRFAFTLPPDEHSGGPAARSPSDHPAYRACLLLFEQDRSTTNEILLAIDWILLLSPALALGIALIAVPLIVRRGLRPMTVLVDRMRDIGPNAPGQRLAASGMRELDPLVTRFNDVLGRMDDGLARERQFASGLAHETRTRLAELRALTEVESRYPSDRGLPEILGEVGQIGAELEATVTALLLLTRLQSGLEQPQPEALPLAAWLQRQLQRQQGQAAARGVTLQLEGAPPAGLRTDPALLEVIVGNLLGNACAYAPAGDTVTVHLSANGLEIDNAAPELRADDLLNFGQRFWRKQPPHAGHAGLGLALAHAAAEALGLRLEFRLDAGQRLHAVLSWPNQMTQRIIRS
ncbi:ATP-binding protein [Rhodanobacter ginsengisoli]|uniref:histidine kinase n=1 Tax=Rhodanobacter ginsengisoli TaxID=418646 RepID=A0ABW0QJI6_9GAMM